MRFSTSVLLPALVGAASAASDPASVYIFQGQEWSNSASPSTLSPEQARLVIAQRLGVSQYHGLNDASEETLSYINKYGGRRDSIFDKLPEDKAAELVLIVDGVTIETAEPLLSSWKSTKPAFLIANPPSTPANQRLASDLNKQRHRKPEAWDMGCELEDAINPNNDRCWSGRTKIMHMDLGLSAKARVSIEDFMTVEERLRRFVKNEEMNVIVILMPGPSRYTKPWTQPYGTYEMPLGSQNSIGRRQSEEPITEPAFMVSPSTVPPVNKVVVSNSTYTPLKGVIPFCFASVDACVSSTNNCSGHGTCRSKYSGKSGGTACFACFCKASVSPSGGNRTIPWSGAACNKTDVSSPFWLLAGLSLVLVAIVSGAIGMLFSIGEEKLPGVIGAGVSSKTR